MKLSNDCPKCKTVDSLVYVVESGEYSDYHIAAIFADEEMAKQFVDAGGGDSYKPWELNTWRPEQGEWTFEFDPATGTIVKESRESNLDEPTSEASAYAWKWHQPIKVTVKVGDRDKAIKIASERYTRIMAYMDQAKHLILKANSTWYRPYPEGLAVEIAEILAGLEKLPEGSKWKDDQGNVRFGYSTHTTDLYRVIGIPLPREPK